MNCPATNFAKSSDETNRPRPRCRAIQVAEMGETVQGILRAGRPLSQVGSQRGAPLSKYQRRGGGTDPLLSAFSIILIESPLDPTLDSCQAFRKSHDIGVKLPKKQKDGCKPPQLDNGRGGLHIYFTPSVLHTHSGDFPSKFRTCLRLVRVGGSYENCTTTERTDDGMLA